MNPQAKPVSNPLKAKHKISMISLGCPKTLVDSELILGKLDPARYEITPSAKSVDVALINTCSFIGEAQKESIDRILELIELKKQKKIGLLVVMGCLVQEFPEILKKEFEEVDAFIGSGDYHKIPELIEKVTGGKSVFEVGTPGYLHTSEEPRFALTPLYSRYLKISEGCDHQCSFCSIPIFRGKHRSRPLEDVAREAEQLANQGCRELIVTGQDTTYYGRDFSGKFLLARLLERLNNVSGIEWIRLMYVYPSCVTQELIEAVADLPHVCKYLDMPLQHASARMLTAMRRGITPQRTLDLIEKLRNRIPNLALRTTFIVGFPGETEKDFQALLDLMKRARFERAGVFRYSPEDKTPAAHLPDQVPDAVKEERFGRAMELQQRIAREIHADWVGKTLQVLVEKAPSSKNPLWQGRSEFDAPEIDGSVSFRSAKKMEIGKIYPVKITQSQEYDLEGIYPSAS